MQQLQQPPPPPALQIRPEAQDPTTFHPPITQPSISTNPHHQIRIRHPHYPHSSSVLLTLFAPDRPDGGIEYGVAHAACGIIAGNRWDGWFSATVDGRDAIELQHGDTLSAGDCYFHLPNSSFENPYPIVPTFREWSFPHDDLHPFWRREESIPLAQSRFAAPSSLSTAVLYRDQTCRMSGSSEGTQAAHLCPRSEEAWFQRNGMSRYNLNPLLIATMPLEDTSNALLLRQDLHTHFDAHKFVFVPKKAGEETPLVTHLLIPSRELGILYHNVRLKAINDVDIAFLFARFAWSIFTLVAGFLRNGVQRSVIGTTISVDGKPRVFNATDCNALISSPKSRNSSPTKRLRKTDEGYDAKSKRRSISSNLSDIGTESNVGVGVEKVEEGRHKRRRTTSDPSEVQTPMDESFEDEKHYKRRRTISSDGPEVPTSVDAIESLRRAWLLKERERSDPQMTWDQEEEWARGMREGGGVMGPEDANRWWWFLGCDVHNDEV